MEEISKTKIGHFHSLSKKKFREKTGLFIVEGEKSFFDTLGNFKLENIIALREWYESHGDVVKKYNSKALVADRERMKKISSLSTPPEVIAIFHLPEYSGENLRPDPLGLNLLLDDVQDPGNLGTIIRTAHWFGIKKIFASEDTVDLYNPKTIQSAMGSLGKVEVIYCNLVNLLEGCRELPVYGTLLNGENIYEAELSEHGIIVMGNEGNGISDRIRDFITSPLLIPPYSATNHSESLNVAIATAVTLSQFRCRK